MAEEDTILVADELSAERKAEVNREWLISQAEGFRWCAHKAHHDLIAMESLLRASDRQLSRAMADTRALRDRILELELERDSLLYGHDWPLPSNRVPTSTCSQCGEMYEIAKDRPCPTVLTRHRLDEDWAAWRDSEEAREAKQDRRQRRAAQRNEWKEEEHGVPSG